MNVDEELIRRKLLSVEKHVSAIKKIVNVPLSEIEEDLHNQLIIERLFEIIAQSIIDICTHVVSRESDEIPRTYSDCMKKLAKIRDSIKEITYEIVKSISVKIPPAMK